MKNLILGTQEGKLKELFITGVVGRKLLLHCKGEGEEDSIIKRMVELREIVLG